MKYSVNSAIRHLPYGHLSMKKGGFQGIREEDIAVLRHCSPNNKELEQSQLPKCILTMMVLGRRNNQGFQKVNCPY